MKEYRVIHADVRDGLRSLPDESVQCMITSPPYWGMRDYNTPGQLGSEPTPELYVQHMVEVCREARRVLRKDGVFFLNVGDSYANSGQTGNDRRGKLTNGGKPRYTPVAGLKHKDLVMVPARVALALQADEWWLRDDIAWVKAWQDEDNTLEGNTMPGSQEDRFTSAWEHVFLLTKSQRYFFDIEAVKTNSGATPRNVLRVNPQGFKEAHFATFPPALVAPLIKAGTPEWGVCPECLAPWKRTVAKDVTYTRNSVGGHAANYRENTPVSGGATRLHLRPEVSTATVGWEPTCRCGRTDTIPATVLDFFWGAGTTGLVALRLGRRALGVELNETYIEMSHRRIRRDPEAMNLTMQLVEDTA